MFENVGGKIKGCVQVVCWVGIIGFVALGMYYISEAGNRYMGEVYTMMGLFYLFIGPLLCWVSSLVAYGFGELVEKTAEIHNHLVKSEELPEQEEEGSDKEKVGNTEKDWFCSHCGKRHEAHEVKCDCGTEKPLA